MQCVILAGGLGTRMAKAAPALPKALVPVAGSPFAHHQLTLLSSRGIRRILYCIGHRGEAIRRYVGDGTAWKLDVQYVDEGEELRGTAGALRFALDEGALESSFLVLYGDSYLPIDYSAVGSALERIENGGLLTVLRNENQWDTSNVLMANGQVVLYDKRRIDPRAGAMVHIDYGLSGLHSSMVDRYVPSRQKVDLADVYHQMSLDGELAAFEVTERFYEVGSPAGVKDLENYLMGHLPAGSRVE